MEQKFYICKKCGNMVARVKETKVNISCCEEEMKELIPNTVDAASEKHVPIYKVEGNKVNVKVGEIEHPRRTFNRVDFYSNKSWKSKKIIKIKGKARSRLLNT